MVRSIPSLLAVGMLSAAAAQASSDFDGYADLVERVNPAVVTVLVTGDEPGEPIDVQALPFGPDSPFEEFFRRFGFPTPDARRGDEPVRAIGSGFLLDDKGHIVTNDHVVQHAASIRVRLADERELEAKVIGTDEKTDLALLKVDADKPLPHAVLGDSDKTRVGEAVVAVGNPFGLGDTVTTGIISARGRDLDTGPYVDYFQTDAAINRGNSGGPLFNTRGEVIGVNSAIFSPNGGSVGVGFAIPSNVVRTVAAELEAHGAVERGWLGVTIQPLTPDLAEATGVDAGRGALVADVAPDSPADGKLRPGDVILAFDGTKVETVRDLPKLVGATRAGSKVRVDFQRDGKARSVDVAIAPLAEEDVVARRTPTGSRRGGVANERLAATVAPLTDVARTQLGLDESTRGVVVTSLERGGAAAAAGLRVGDVIERIGSRDVGNADDVEAALAATPRQTALLLVNRRGSERFVGVRMG